MQVVPDFLDAPCAFAFKKVAALSALCRNSTARSHVAERDRRINRPINRTRWEVSTVHRFVAANDKVQQRGRLERRRASKSCHAGPVCCNGWFGPETLNVPDPLDPDTPDPVHLFRAVTVADRSGGPAARLRTRPGPGRARYSHRSGSAGRSPHRRPGCRV